MTSSMPPPLPSVWEESLRGHLKEHADTEQAMLKTYGEATKDAPKHVRYLFRILLEDEARHHRLFTEMLDTLDEQTGVRRGEAPVPDIDTSDGAPRDELVRQTVKYIELEKQDLKELKKLQKELRPIRDTTLFSLLVRLMEFDTQKHVALLEFIRDTSNRRW